jgi:hypothetical protein
MYKKVCMALTLVFFVIGLGQANAGADSDQNLTQVYKMTLTKKAFLISEEMLHRDFNAFYTVEVENTGKYPLEFDVQYRKLNGMLYPSYKVDVLQSGEKRRIINLKFNKGEEPSKVFLTLKSCKRCGFIGRFLAVEYTYGAEGTLKVYKQNHKDHLFL